VWQHQHAAGAVINNLILAAGLVGQQALGG
jgi:hypothetical protein